MTNPTPEKIASWIEKRRAKDRTPEGIAALIVIARNPTSELDSTVCYDFPDGGYYCEDVDDLLSRFADVLEALSTQPEPEWKWGVETLGKMRWPARSESSARKAIADNGGKLLRRTPAVNYGDWEEVTE